MGCCFFGVNRGVREAPLETHAPVDSERCFSIKRPNEGQPSALNLKPLPLNPKRLPFYPRCAYESTHDDHSHAECFNAPQLSVRRGCDIGSVCGVCSLVFTVET